MEDNKLAAEESRRAQQHESVKSEIEGNVKAEMAESANRAAPPGESRRIETVAGQFRSKAVEEVIDTEREAERWRGLARISQVGDYRFCGIYALRWPRCRLAFCPP